MYPAAQWTVLPDCPHKHFKSQKFRTTLAPNMPPLLVIPTVKLCPVHTQWFHSKTKTWAYCLLWLPWQQDGDQSPTCSTHCSLSCGLTRLDPSPGTLRSRHTKLQGQPRWLRLHTPVYSVLSTWNTLSHCPTLSTVTVVLQLQSPSQHPQEA